MYGHFLGWRREVVHRSVSSTNLTKSSSKPHADVYYFAPPDNKKLVCVISDLVTYFYAALDEL